MKRFLSVIVIFLCCLLSGCFSCLSSWCLGKDTYVSLMHPKGLGEYWEKPGMTTDSWRTDWVSCGGINDGGYSAGVPPRSSEKILRAAIDTKLNHLWVCMSEKGYHFTEQWSSDW